MRFRLRRDGVDWARYVVASVLGRVFPWGSEVPRAAEPLDPAEYFHLVCNLFTIYSNYFEALTLFT